MTILFTEFFFPGSGVIIQGVMRYLVPNTVLKEYQDYIKLRKLKIHNEDVVYDKSLVGLGVLDTLKFGFHEKKKDVLREIKGKNLKSRVALLKLALQENESEIVHYASTMLGYYSKSFEVKIALCKEEKHQKYAFHKMILYLERYIESGLLSGEIKRVYIEEYVKSLIQFYSERSEIGEKIKIRLASGYIALEQRDEAKQVLSNVNLEKLGKNSLVMLLQLHYTLGNLSEVRRIVKYISFYSLSLQEEQLVDFWSRRV